MIPVSMETATRFGTKVECFLLVTSWRVLISIPDSSENERNQNDLGFDEYEEHNTGNETAEGEGEDLSRAYRVGRGC